MRRGAPDAQGGSTHEREARRSGTLSKILAVNSIVCMPATWLCDHHQAARAVQTGRGRVPHLNGFNGRATPIRENFCKFVTCEFVKCGQGFRPLRPFEHVSCIVQRRPMVPAHTLPPGPNRAPARPQLCRNIFQGRGSCIGRWRDAEDAVLSSQVCHA